MSKQKGHVERRFISYSDLILLIPSRQPYTLLVLLLSLKVKVKHQLSLSTVMKIRNTTFQRNPKLRIFHKIISVSICLFTKTIIMASNSTMCLGSDKKKKLFSRPWRYDLEFENIYMDLRSFMNTIVEIRSHFFVVSQATHISISFESFDVLGRRSTATIHLCKFGLCFYRTRERTLREMGSLGEKAYSY